MQSDEWEPDRVGSDRAHPEQQRATGVTPGSDATVVPGKTFRRFRGWRGWLLRVLLLIVSPLVFFGLFEIGLRLAGYGYPTRFFLGPDEQGIYRTNPQFGWRFFPPSLARTPEPCRLRVPSPETIRIYVLGESAAMGMPNPAFSFGRILEVMLSVRYPDTRFEVVNAAMTAINSHVILEVANDCASQGGDLFVMYMGNNEVVGPYGPGTVFPGMARSLAAVRAAVWVKSTRVGQLLGHLIDSSRRRDDIPDRWRGMQMFLGNRVAQDDPRLTAVYDHFRRNLTDICRAARRADAPVILATVAVNLTDCPPLASLHRSDLSADELTRWETLYAAGAEAESRGDWVAALEQWQAAADIDDRFAELQFRRAQGLAAQGRFPEARERFRQACDLDALRFRADSRINAIIRDVAAAEQGPHMRFVDAEHALADETTVGDGLPGAEYFYEHVHLTFAGNYRLAEAMFDQVCEALPEGVRAGAVGPGAAKTQCADWLALTAWDEFHMAESMAQLTSKPPFTDQLHHAARQAAVLEQVARLRHVAFAPAALQEAVSIYERALARRPDDWYLHDRVAYLANLGGRPDVAAHHWRIVLRDFPDLVDRRTQLAEALLNQGNADEAAKEFRTVLAAQPRDAGAHNGLGMALIDQGQWELAVGHLRQALELDPQYYAAQVNLGMALSAQGDLAAALSHYRRAVEIDPDRTEAHVNLATLLHREGQVAGAIPHWREMIRLQPERVEWLNQLAFVLATCPTAAVRNGGEAIELAERAVAISEGDDPLTLDTLAAAYAETGDYGKAVETAQQAMALAYRQNKITLADTLRTRIHLYQGNSPLRDTREKGGLPY